MVVARGCRDGKRGDVVQRIQTSNYKMPSSVDLIFSMVNIVKNTVLSFKVAKRTPKQNGASDGWLPASLPLGPEALHPSPWTCLSQSKQSPSSLTPSQESHSCPRAPPGARASRLPSWYEFSVQSVSCSMLLLLLSCFSRVRAS